MLMANDGGGGSAYDAKTQRENLATIGSASAHSIGEGEQMWRDTGRAADEIWTLINKRLNDLTGEGGWTGAGAEAFRSMINDDLLRHLQTYAQHAGAMADKIKPITDTVNDSYTTATSNSVPWDVDAAWHVDRKPPEHTLWGRVDEFFTGDDDQWIAADAKEPYRLYNGHQQQLRTMDKQYWESLRNATPEVTPPAIYSQTNTAVTPQVHRFDRLMEAMGMNSAPAAKVRTSAEQVNSQLGGFSPEPLEPFSFRGGAFTASQAPHQMTPLAPGSTTLFAPTSPGRADGIDTPGFGVDGTGVDAAPHSPETPGHNGTPRPDALTGPHANSGPDGLSLGHDGHDASRLHGLPGSSDGSSAHALAPHNPLFPSGISGSHVPGLFPDGTQLPDGLDPHGLHPGADGYADPGRISNDPQSGHQLGVGPGDPGSLRDPGKISAPGTVAAGIEPNLGQPSSSAYGVNAPSATLTGPAGRPVLPGVPGLAVPGPIGPGVSTPAGLAGRIGPGTMGPGSGVPGVLPIASGLNTPGNVGTKGVNGPSFKGPDLKGPGLAAGLNSPATPGPKGRPAGLNGNVLRTPGTDGSSGLRSAAGASFGIGPGGKGVVNPGLVGSLGPSTNGPRGPMAAGETADTNPMLGAPLGGARGQRDQERKNSYPTWLEEDERAWDCAEDRRVHTGNI